MNASPLQVFQFQVRFSEASFEHPGATPVPLAEGGFAEISGLESQMEVKSLREGGLNSHQHQRAGAVSHATVVLRRGMARVHQLGRWFQLLAAGQYAGRLDVEIEILGRDGQPALRASLRRALPVRYRAAELNANRSEVGIEELQLVHEGLHWSGPESGS